jgi:hypothetical protein
MKAAYNKEMLLLHTRGDIFSAFVKKVDFMLLLKST